VDAAAVKKSIDRTMTLNEGAAFIWDAVDSIDADGQTVTFHLSYAAPIDLIASAGYAAWIMSPASADQPESWFNEGNDGGSGPYRITKITPGEEVVFTAYEDYWQGPSDGQYTNAIIKKVSESSARRQLVEKGEATLSEDFSSTDFNALSANSDLTVDLEGSWRNVIGFFNTAKPPLDNADLRRALVYAFPYKEAYSDIREGQATQSYGLVPPGLWGHDESLPQATTDLAKAKEYLDKSGVDVTGLSLEMTFTAGDDAYRSFAQLYQINLKELGIDLQIREMNWDNLWERSKSTSPADRQDILVMNWWPDYASALSWFTSLVRSEDEVLFNLSYIKDPALDEKITEAEKLQATDRDEAEKLLIEVQQTCIDEAYFIHIYDDMDAWIVNSKVKGFGTNPAYQGVVFFYNLSE